jgi:HK97 family phage major capsid protein
VPSEFSKAIFDYRDEVGVARKLATVLPMGSDTLSVPKLSSGPTTYVVGEESQITASDASFERVNLTAKKRACFGYVSSELADDNAVGLMDLLAQRMGLSLAVQEDAEFIQGDGTSTYGGVIGCKTIFTTATAGVVQAATNNDTWPEITYADIALAMAKVASKYRTGGELAFLCSSAAKWQVLDRLILAQGGATAGNLAAGVGVNSFASYPVYVSDNGMPITTAANTIFLLFGNFRLCSLFGSRQDMRVAVSPHLKFDYDQLAIRATVRYDIAHHEFGDGSTAGGVVALKTAS